MGTPEVQRNTTMRFGKLSELNWRWDNEGMGYYFFSSAQFLFPLEIKSADYKSQATCFGDPEWLQHFILLLGCPLAKPSETHKPPVYSTAWFTMPGLSKL